MGYLEEFQRRLENRDYPAFKILWEEYCAGDEVDAPELKQILLLIKNSSLTTAFNKHIDEALLLWQAISDEAHAYDVLKLIIDIQSTNSSELADICIDIIQKKFGHLPHYNEKLRLVGLRNREQFQGALANFELLSHIGKGKFVFHAGGWGTGEIIDFSLVREQLSIEFERVSGKKDLSLSNAFKNLSPLPDAHFLARRFGHPDALEAEAKKDPNAVIRLLLQDLGPKTAAEIKEELSGWVIPDEEWTKWWQSARAKIKKDPLVEAPENLRQPFRLRDTACSHYERFHTALQQTEDTEALISLVYAQLRDFPQSAKEESLVTALQKRLSEQLHNSSLSEAQQLQVLFLLNDILPNQPLPSDWMAQVKNMTSLIQNISTAALKKRALVLVRNQRADWEEIFFYFLFERTAHTLRDYLIKELSQGKTAPLFEERISQLVEHPDQQPELFVWYFQKILHDSHLPFGDQEGLWCAFEALITLLNIIEQRSDMRDLVKKIHTLLESNRFALVRSMLEHSSLEQAQEFLLLVSKCHSIADHNQNTMHALAAVVHPSLARKKSRGSHDDAHHQVIWTTQEGYQKVQERIKQIGTVETIENAREIEAARAHGDLRENSEYKFALEKRARLQGELKLLSSQLNKARIITTYDIPQNEIGVGTRVELVNSQGTTTTYTLLGPWDADSDKNILSLHSKLAQAMSGKKLNETFRFQEEEYTVKSIQSYLS